MALKEFFCSLDNTSFLYRQFHLSLENSLSHYLSWQKSFSFSTTPGNFSIWSFCSRQHSFSLFTLLSLDSFFSLSTTWKKCQYVCKTDILLSGEKQTINLCVILMVNAFSDFISLIFCRVGRVRGFTSHITEAKLAWNSHHVPELNSIPNFVADLKSLNYVVNVYS